MKTVWITGASSGIGEACAHLYATKGDRLILTSSSHEKLEKVADQCKHLGASDVLVLPYDFVNQEGIKLLVRNAWDEFGGIDILFCNAGISQRSSVEETSMALTRKIMEINFFAPVAMTKAIIPLMKEAGGGKIAVTTSIAGVFGFPLRCAYSASKHALYGFFETVQAECYSSDIQVTFVCPGRVQTNISFNALDSKGEKYGRMDPGQANGISPEQAAQKIVNAIDRGQREVLIGRYELLMVYIKRFFPNLCARLIRRITPI